MFRKIRDKMKVVVIIVVVAMLGGGLWAAVSYLFGGTVAQTEAAVVVATVNDQAIHSYDLNQVFLNQLRQIEAQEGVIPGRAYESVRYQALDLLVGSLVLNQEIAKRNLGATKAEIDAELQRIIDLFPSVEDYKMQLQYAGMTEEVLRAQLGEEVKYNKLTKEIIGDVPVSEEEIREAYEQVRTSHILIRPEGDSEEDWAALEARAWEIHTQVTTDNFAEMAASLSADGSSVQGGDIGFVPRGATVEEYEDVAFALQVGEISEPVRSTYGYHIITVTERLEAEGEEFEAERSQIEESIRSQKGEGDLIAWFEGARDAANIVIMDYQMRAFDHMQDEEYENAVHYYKLAVEGQPGDAYLYASLGDAYFELGNVDEAIAQYKLATEAVNDYTLLAALGDLYRGVERLDEAADAYLRASELVPQDIWTQLALYQYLASMEKHDEAQIIEERIEAFQAMQDEHLREQQEQEAGADTESVEVEKVEEPIEATGGDSDAEN